MGERELVLGGMASLGVVERLKQLGVVAERARDGADPADVLGMPPPRVVPTAVGV
jgi:hypothetical protein